MKFARVNGARREAERGLIGECPVCDQRMTPKCGEIVVHHWAHYRKRECDPWWENETEWHRRWKNLFPESWQEVVHTAPSGEKHIADIKTERGWVIEFQHSAISSVERRSRDAFYGKIIWVVDGTRLPSDPESFARAWRNGLPIGAMPSLRRLRSTDCSLLRRWARSEAPIFLDLGIPQNIWWLLPGRSGDFVYVATFSRAEFVASHVSDAGQKGKAFDDLIRDFKGLANDYEARISRLLQPQSFRAPVRRYPRF